MRRGGGERGGGREGWEEGKGERGRGRKEKGRREEGKGKETRREQGASEGVRQCPSCLLTHSSRLFLLHGKFLPKILLFPRLFASVYTYMFVHSHLSIVQELCHMHCFKI